MVMSGWWFQTCLVFNPVLEDNPQSHSYTFQGNMMKPSTSCVRLPKFEYKPRGNSGHGMVGATET